MLEMLVVIILTFSTGYGTRWYQEPTKPPLNIPQKYFDQYKVLEDCFELEGKEECLLIEKPRYLISSDNYKGIGKYIEGMRGHLKICNELYNMD